MDNTIVIGAGICFPVGATAAQGGSLSLNFISDGSYPLLFSAGALESCPVVSRKVSGKLPTSRPRSGDVTASCDRCLSRRYLRL